jgi:hypothetical protein
MLVAQIAWRTWTDRWASGIEEPSLDAGLSAAEVAREAEAHRAHLAAEANQVAAPAQSGKGGGRSSSRSASPSSAQQQKAALAAEKASSSSSDLPSPTGGKRNKRASSKEREAAAMASAAAAALAAAAEATDQTAALAALTSNALASPDWERSLDALPRPLHSQRPRSLRAILAWLHRAMHAALMHSGAQHSRVVRICALLVDIHVRCRDVAEEALARQQQQGVAGTPLRPFHDPAYHAALAAYWLNVSARTSAGLAFLQRHAVDELAALPLPSLVNPEPASVAGLGGPAATLAASAQPFPLPAYIQAELVEAHRLRAERRKQEVSFLLAGQSDPAASAAVAAAGADSAFSFAGGGKGDKKDRAERGGDGKRGASAADPVGTDAAISTRSLLLYLLSLRAETRARAFESEIQAAASNEEATVLDVAAFLRSFPAFMERCAPVQWDALMEEQFGAAAQATALGSSGVSAPLPTIDGSVAGDGSAGQLTAVRNALEEVGVGAPGSLEGVWSAPAALNLSAPRAEAATKTDALTLTLVLSTDLTRGAAPVSAAVAPASKGAKKGAKAPIPSSSGGTASPGSTSPTHSRKKKAAGATGAGAVSDGVDQTRTAAQALFGPTAPRFEVLRIRVSKEGVSKLAAKAAALRYTITARMDAAAAASSSSGSGSSSSLPPSFSEQQQQLTPREAETFLQLVKEVETSFGSLRPAATAAQAGGHSSSHDVYSSESTLGSFYAREYGLYPSMGELSALESILSHGQGSAGSGVAAGATGSFRVASSNGWALLLHQCSQRSVDAMQRQQEADKAAADASLVAAAAAAAAMPVKGGKAAAEREAKAAAAAAAAETSARSARSSSSPRDHGVLSPSANGADL